MDPSYLSRIVEAAKMRAREAFQGQPFDVAIVHQRFTATQDVSVATGDPVKVEWFADSADFEVLSPNGYELVKGRNAPSGVLHTIGAIGLEIQLPAAVGLAAADQIADVVGDGYTEGYVGSTKAWSLNNGQIVCGKGKSTHGNDATVDTRGGLRPEPMHPLGHAVHLAQGDVFRGFTYYDGSRWSGLSMTTDFDLAGMLLDVVCFI